MVIEVLLDDGVKLQVSHFNINNSLSLTLCFRIALVWVLHQNLQLNLGVLSAITQMLLNGMKPLDLGIYYS